MAAVVTGAAKLIGQYIEGAEKKKTKTLAINCL